MKSAACLFVLLCFSVVPFIGCERASQADSDNNQRGDETITPNFDGEVLAAAADYLKYPMATRDAGVAPAACAAMPPPPSAKLSNSDDDASHGQKIYFLFAKDDEDYNVGKGAAPVGQVIVKESWVAELSEEPEHRYEQHASGHEVLAVAWKNEKGYIAKEKGPLFIMLKLAADTPGTDNGWVYATTSADGQTVNEAGKLQNCMECHQDAPRDRLFGLQ